MLFFDMKKLFYAFIALLVFLAFAVTAHAAISTVPWTRNSAIPAVYIPYIGDLAGFGTSTPWGKVSVANTNSSIPSFVVSTSSDSQALVIDGNGNVLLPHDYSKLIVGGGAIANSSNSQIQINTPAGSTATTSMSFGQVAGVGWGIGATQPGAPNFNLWINDGNPMFTMQRNGSAPSFTNLYGQTSTGATTQGILNLKDTPGNPSNTLSLGFDSTNNWGWLRSVKVGVADRPFAIFTNGATATAPPFYFGATGNLGVGTIAPTAPVTVARTLAADSTLVQLDNVTNTKFNTNLDFTVLGGSVPVARIQSIYPSGNSVGLGFWTYGTVPTTGMLERMRITDNGNVGIGITAPTSKLDVAGFINTDQYSGYKQNGTTILTASSTNRNTLGGIGAGANLLTTTSLTGNTAFGYNAMNTATSSWNVTAIGNYALGSLNDCETLTGASHCSMTAIGSSALANNTTGYWNTAVGSGAMIFNTTGSQNNAFGTSAMTNNTTGGGNQGIGFSALSNNVIGNGNTAIGGQALQASLSSSNVGIGQYAGIYQVGGSGGNVFLGSQSGLGVVGVSNSDSNSTIDTQMVFLGYQASRDPNGMASTTTMVNSMALGSRSQVGASNSVAIGGTGAQSVNVGVGTSTPYALVSIHAGTGKTLPSTTLFAIASSTATATTTLFAIDNNGHQLGLSTNPTLSACGTSPTQTGDDRHGTITAGATATGCTITFANPYGADPVVVVTPQTGSVVNTFSYTHSATNIVVTETGLGGNRFDYIVMGTK
jgi:hypothetical protein